MAFFSMKRPVGSRAASRTISIPAGASVMPVIPALRSAAELATEYTGGLFQ
jgi:hypothetical protein